MGFHIYRGRVNCSSRDILSQFVLAIVSPVTDSSHAFLKLVGERKSTEECAACKCQSWACLQMTQLQCLVGCHGHHAILCNSKRFVLGDNKNSWYLVVPPLVQGKSYKPPRCMCVCGGGRGANNYSMILPLF